MGKRDKQCNHCDQLATTLFRVQYLQDKKWYFLCEKCVLEEKATNPLYRYGGTWKK